MPPNCTPPSPVLARGVCSHRCHYHRGRRSQGTAGATEAGEQPFTLTPSTDSPEDTSPHSSRLFTKEPPPHNPEGSTDLQMLRKVAKVSMPRQAIPPTGATRGTPVLSGCSTPGGNRSGVARANHTLARGKRGQAAPGPGPEKKNAPPGPGRGRGPAGIPGGWGARNPRPQGSGSVCCGPRPSARAKNTLPGGRGLPSLTRA